MGRGFRGGDGKKITFILSIFIALSFQNHFTQAQDSTATPAPDVAIPACAAQPEATPESTDTPEATPEMTATVAPDSDSPLYFESFLPTDITFNPDSENPVVIVMVFSLVFHNQLNQSIELRAPHFQLAIEGVPWGDVASTDFQMGQLLANATQGIVLQSLTFASQTTDAQKAVLDCIRSASPLDLTLTGTLDAYVDGNQQTLQVELTTPDVIIQARKPQS